VRCSAVDRGCAQALREGRQATHLSLVRVQNRANPPNRPKHTPKGQRAFPCSRRSSSTKRLPPPQAQRAAFGEVEEGVCTPATPPPSRRWAEHLLYKHQGQGRRPARPLGASRHRLRPRHLKRRYPGRLLPDGVPDEGETFAMFAFTDYRLNVSPRRTQSGLAASVSNT
jgi:transcriptional regulator with AAA-type ATPase domain